MGIHYYTKKFTLNYINIQLRVCHKSGGGNREKSPGQKGIPAETEPLSEHAAADAECGKQTSQSFIATGGFPAIAPAPTKKSSLLSIVIL
jgi:hypothetical protein